MRHVTTPQGEPLDGLLPPAPEQRAGAIKELARVRREAADAIERLLELLDAVDGDCDLEPSIGGDASWRT